MTQGSGWPPRGRSGPGRGDSLRRSDLAWTLTGSLSGIVVGLLLGRHLHLLLPTRVLTPESAHGWLAGLYLGALAGAGCSAASRRSWRGVLAAGGIVVLIVAFTAMRVGQGGG